MPPLGRRCADNGLTQGASDATSEETMCERARVGVASDDCDQVRAEAAVDGGHMNLPWDKLNPDIQSLSTHHPHDPGVLGTKARVDAVLVEHLSQTVDRLGVVIGENANQVARGTKIISEAIDSFERTASKSTVDLCDAVDRFCHSMDNSSKEMASLTRWLVFFTALLAFFTAVLVLKELNMLPR